MGHRLDLYIIKRGGELEDSYKILMGIDCAYTFLNKEKSEMKLENFKVAIA